MAARRKDAGFEYDKVKAFYAFFVERRFKLEGLPPEAHPIACLEMLEKMSSTMARDGLRQAVNDCITMASGWHHTEVEKFDSELRSRGIVTLSEMRRRFSKSYAAILKRARIKNETEYHLIRNVLDDTAEKAAEERDALAKLISEFERA
jgi:hypothetical protein